MTQVFGDRPQRFFLDHTVQNFQIHLGSKHGYWRAFRCRSTTGLITSAELLGFSRSKMVPR